MQSTLAAKTWNMYALAYCSVVIALTPSGRLENVFLIQLILRPPYSNVVAGGVTSSKFWQTVPQSKLVGSHSTLPSIGNPVMIAISCKVIEISQVGRWNVWVSDRHLWETAPPARFDMMLGQTHVNGWSRVIASQNGGSTSYIFPLRLGVLQWSRHLFNYLDK